MFQCSNVPIKQSDNSALSLILTLLIISSILTGAVLVGDILIRHSQIIKGTEISEIAYFAAESAMEKAEYGVLKNYEDISTYTLTGTLTDTDVSYALVSVDADASCPNPDGIECDSGDISGSNTWLIRLESNQSFQLNLDIKGAVYPATLTIYRTGTSPSDLLIYECTAQDSPPGCSSTASQVFKVSFPYVKSGISVPTNYYKIRINNLGDSYERYTLVPSGVLPIGLDISVKGIYSGYERKIKNNFPKWQKFGI